MKLISKVLNPCSVSAGGKFKSQVFVNVKFDDGRLSITGVVGPLSSGNAVGSCGQIVDELTSNTRTINKGWTPEMIDMLVSVWNEWHLNDMRPGTPRQNAFVTALRSSENADYTDACEALAVADLLEDTEMWFDNKRKMVVTPTTAQLKCWQEFAAARQKFMTPAMKQYNNIVKLDDDIVAFIAATKVPGATYSWSEIGRMCDRADKVLKRNTMHSRRGSTSGPIETLTSARPSLKQKTQPTYLSFSEWMDQTYKNPAYTAEVTVSAPYVYGSRWLKQDLPQSVIDTLEALPASTRTPAWV